VQQLKIFGVVVGARVDPKADDGEKDNCGAHHGPNNCSFSHLKPVVFVIVFNLIPHYENQENQVFDGATVICCVLSSAWRSRFGRVLLFSDAYFVWIHARSMSTVNFL
jgi:hypothetical protein